MLAQARAEGRPALEIAREIEDAFHADVSALNIHPADHQPRASESIELMIEMIAKLIEGGHAYPDGQGSVYFDARSFPGYGELSANRFTDLKAGRPAGRSSRASGSTRTGRCGRALPAVGRGGEPGGEPSRGVRQPEPSRGVRQPEPGRRADFRPEKQSELTWATPWGTGFPGWHTECSAMLLHHLGEHVDIHTGGKDLRFPHHENERAQSNSVTGHDVVRGWVHGEHLLFEGRKMSKSTGNVVLLRNLTERGLDPLALRLAFLEHRFRQQMNLTWDTLEAADKTLRRWRERVAQWANSPSAAAAGQVRGGGGHRFRERPGHADGAAGTARGGARSGRARRGQVRDVRVPGPAVRPRPGPRRGQTGRRAAAARRGGRPAGGAGQGARGQRLGGFGPAAGRAGRLGRHGDRHPGGQTWSARADRPGRVVAARSATPKRRL